MLCSHWWEFPDASLVTIVPRCDWPVGSLLQSGPESSSLWRKRDVQLTSFRLKFDFCLVQIMRRASSWFAALMTCLLPGRFCSTAEQKSWKFWPETLTFVSWVPSLKAPNWQCNSLVNLKSVFSGFWFYSLDFVRPTLSDVEEWLFTMLCQVLTSFRRYHQRFWVSQNVGRLVISSNLVESLLIRSRSTTQPLSIVAAARGIVQKAGFSSTISEAAAASRSLSAVE